MLYILYNYFCPAYKAGGPIQSLANLVHYLSESISLRVICGNKDLDGTLLNVSSDEWNDYNAAKVFYSSKGYQGYKNLLKNRDDVAYINGLYSLQYNFYPILFFKGRIIVSARGMLNEQALGQKKWKKKAYLFLWNSLGLCRKCEYHATTEEEKYFIKRSLSNATKVWTIPNFPKVLDLQSLPLKLSGALSLCTVALISPMKNHLLVLEALKKITIEVVYNIYGPVKDDGYWRQCKAVISTLPENVKVHYHGELLPTKISEALSASHVYIQPSKSENFGHSIFEALSAGMPVITSLNTPWNDLEKQKAGVNVTTSNEDIADAIFFFGAMSEQEFAQWKTAARTLALASVDIEQIKSKYLDMFHDRKHA